MLNSVLPPMAWHTIRWFSDLLGKSTETQVIFPDSGTPPFPTLYLLHGLSDDSTMWLRRSRVECHAAAYPLIVVMPDGYRGFYTNNDQGPAYARHVGLELPALIERTFPAIPAREARGIGGLSMGGYGALRVGLGYHDRFCSIHSHSGALGWGKSGEPERLERSTGGGAGFAAELRRVFGPSPAGTDHDLLSLAKRARKASQLPKIRIDCGTEDFLLQENRTFSSELREAKIPHAYKEYMGTHEWGYWDTHIQKALVFHAKNLKVKREGSR